MAQTSITVPISKLFEYFWDAGKAKWYYRALSQNYIVLSESSRSDDYHLLALLPDLHAQLGRHLLYGHSITFRVVPQPKSTPGGWILTSSALKGPIQDENPGSTYIQAPGMAESMSLLELTNSTFYPEPGADVTLSEYVRDSDSLISKTVYTILTTKVFYLQSFLTGDQIKTYTTLLNGSSPYITIYYDSELVAERNLVVSGIKSGYLNPRRANTISWVLPVEPGVYQCLDAFAPPAHETLYWRVSGASSWNAIALPDGASSYDIPANTYPAESDIEWKLSVTDADGITTESSVYSISTTDGTSTVAPTAPVNSVEIGNTPTTFTWTVSNPTGEAPSRVTAEWATDPEAVTWTSLFDIASAVYSFTADPDTFPGGNIYWRITSYNADGDAGPTSDTVTFSCIAPPSPPSGLTASSAPFSTISWQTEVQTAYEIRVDGETVIRKFGIGEYSYQLQDPLPDGEHLIEVRVQGAYGYWSSMASTIVATQNLGAGSIDVTGRFDVDAMLSWTYVGLEAAQAFRIYRDGKYIARTSSNFHSDRIVLGRHSYTVLAELPGGNYIRSDPVEGILKSCVTRIAPAAGGEWLELLLSENSNSTQVFEWSRGTTLRHYAGAVYPVAEFSPYEDRTATYDCAFKTVQEAAAFETLRGQVVILKSRGGEVIIGPLTAMSKTAGDFYLSYHFSVQQIHWEGFIDDTDS